MEASRELGSGPGNSALPCVSDEIVLIRRG